MRIKRFSSRANGWRIDAAGDRFPPSPAVGLLRLLTYVMPLFHEM
jgi:hypothetical protein